MKDDWLKSLKVGDEVLVSQGYHGESIRKIDRVTPTQFVIGNLRFNAKDGWGRGDYGWYRPMISEPTKEARDRIARKQAIEHLRRADFTNIATETLVAAAAMLKGEKT